MFRSRVHKHLRRTRKGVRLIRNHSRRIKNKKRSFDSPTNFFQADPQKKLINGLENEKKFLDQELELLNNRTRIIGRMKQENIQISRWIKRRAS